MFSRSSRDSLLHFSSASVSGGPWLSYADQPAHEGVAMKARGEVVIDAFVESALRHDDTAIVCVDVLIAGTTIVTAVAQGREGYVVGTIEEARARASRIPGGMIVTDGSLPTAEFDTIGPAALEHDVPAGKAIVLAARTAKMLANARGARAAFVACLRNLSATADYLASRHPRVAVLAAGHGAQRRCEDQMASARLAQLLVERGYEPKGPSTGWEIERWARADLSMARLGKGAEHLLSRGLSRELDFVLDHVDDLDVVCGYDGADGRLRSIEQRRSGPRQSVAAWGPVEHGAI